ncbi:MAG: sodium:proton antiporter [Bacteroidetes bacterium GWA2_31_9b]|nr:MAG: sodium:proton antiporter [Bacteroidetes bacterium GWA2_31_9b]
MFYLMIFVFVLGYTAIALEHKIKINKAPVALFLGVSLWVMLMFDSQNVISSDIGGRFTNFLKEHSDIAGLPQWEQYIQFIAENQLLGFLSEIAEILFFLMGAMTIVEIVDQHGGFNIITNRIHTRKKVYLLWIIAIITFFMSSVLDNLTTAIVMIALLRKLISKRQYRWLYAGIVIIAANAGGAWSPIGDVTTIMLWINGNVTTGGIVPTLFLPSLVSMIVPLVILSFYIKGSFPEIKKGELANPNLVAIATQRERYIILILGIGSLLFVPIFKVFTHLPPFLGMLFGLSVLWIFTEIMYRRKHDLDENEKMTVARVLKNVDVPTILFFLGILSAVDALQTAGHLTLVSDWLDRSFSSVYPPNILIGLLSSVVDNVPLVAGAMGMHEVVSPEMLANAANPAVLANYVTDGKFWTLLAYCAGTGGSILIIGSAAGVAVMGLEKIDFIWFLKRISLFALIGYFAGILTFYLMIG